MIEPTTQPRRRKHRRLRKGQRAKQRQVDRVGGRRYRKARRQLEKCGPTRNVAVQVQPEPLRNRTSDVNNSAAEVATLLSERQQLRTELANARDRIDLLELQTSCNFSAAQIQKIESACGVKRVTAEALASGACEYATSSDEELVATEEEDSVQPYTAAVPAATIPPATVIQDAAVAEASPPEDSATPEEKDKPQSKTQKRKELRRQELAQRAAAEAHAKMQRIPWIQRQTETQLLFVFAMTIIGIFLIVVGIVYVLNMYMHMSEDTRNFFRQFSLYNSQST